MTLYFNIVSLYLNNMKFLQVRKILFPLLFFTTACQLDQSLDKLRNTLFESEENQQIVETKKIDEVEETKIIVKREEKVQENKNKEKKKMFNFLHQIK